MDFRYSPAAESFRSELRGWLAEHLTDTVVKAGTRRDHDPDAFETVREWNRTLADAGWAAISWPTEFGGREAGAVEQLVYVEETTRARAPMPINTIGLNNIAPVIMELGTAEQKRTLLPRMRRGDDIWCQGMSEPGAGSDLASLRTRAVREGDHYVINGQKIWTSLGHRADYCQLYVRTDPDAPKHKGISCLIVDMSLPGIEARPLVTLTGESGFAEVFFDNVRVPAAALLGAENAGWQVANATLTHERAGAARLYAELQVRLEELVNDLPTDPIDWPDDRRNALPDPITLHRLGEISVRLSYLEMLCRRAISAASSGSPAAAASAGAAAGLAKSVWGELGQDLAALAYEQLGGADTEAGEHWSEYRVAARALTIAGGTTQITRNVTAQRVLGMPRR